MPYRFLEGITVADVAFEARGKTLEALFTSAGLAVTATQLHDLRTIRKKESRAFDLKNKKIDLLLFNFLQDLIYWKDVDLFLFKSFELSIRPASDGSDHLTGIGYGEPIDLTRHHLRVDVKAVTMHKFKVTSDANGWKAIVVLDI